MDVPSDFTLGIPTSFGRQLDLGPDGIPDGVWVEVAGGGIPMPLVVRIGRASDGRFVVTGMLVGRDEHKELDWAALRGIKPASIISMIFAGWDPRDPAALLNQKAAEWATLEPPITDAELAAAGGNYYDLDPWVIDPDDEATVARARRLQAEEFRALVAHEIWRKTGGQLPQPDATEATKPRASVATNLTEFASTYNRNYATDRRRATTATAEQLHISRATAIRRIKECRELGLIPAQEQP
jgi:hypothetical protein